MHDPRRNTPDQQQFGQAALSVADRISERRLARAKTVMTCEPISRMLRSIAGLKSPGVILSFERDLREGNM